MSSENLTAFPPPREYVVNISVSQPPWLAKPIYGVAAPLIILLTLVTNTLVVVVLSHKNLRTPTNCILLSMAVTELMTGLSSCPWFLYYYSLGGLERDVSEGLPQFWCRFHSYFAVHFPTIFHTAAIWLTVYLAVQRYIYVCVPSLVFKYCTPRRTRQIITGIVLCSFANEIPVMAAEHHHSVEHNARRFCLHAYQPFVLDNLGLPIYKGVLLVTRALLVHIAPCVLLIVFTGCLFRTIDRADRKRSHNVLIKKQPPPRADSPPKGATSCLSSNRLMHATTRMLLVVIAIFLLIEVPLAIIFILHFLVVYYKFLDMADYDIVNVLLILRNFFIIFTYPLNFAIYFGMSSSFKLQFRQLFTSKILYVTSPSTSNGRRPRFSVQLIDIHKIRRMSGQRKHVAGLTRLHAITNNQPSQAVQGLVTDEYL